MHAIPYPYPTPKIKRDKYNDAGETRFNAVGIALNRFYIDVILPAQDYCHYWLGHKTSLDKFLVAETHFLLRALYERSFLV